METNEIKTLSVETQIIGEWTVVKAEGMAASMNKGTVYSFMEDGKAKTGTGFMASDYIYSIKGDILEMDYEGSGQIVLAWTYKIDGNTMILDNASDANQTLWLEK